MTRKIVYGIILIGLSFTTAFTQIDEERMARDLKIAQDILSTLSNGDNKRLFYDNVESNYIPDYGVVFSIPRTTFTYSTSGSGSTVVVSGGSGSTYVVAPDPVDEVDAVDEDERKVRVARKVIESKEKWAENANEEVKEQMTLFLVDYADLIGQLKPSDRIVVQSRGRNDRIFYNGRQSVKNQNGLSAQILKSDIIDYKQGKLNREQVIDKITFTSDENGEIAKDLELFATIFSRLYEPDLSSTYYLASRSIGYTKLDGFGVTFNMKMYSSTSDNGLHTIRTTGEGGLTQDQRDEKVDAMYPEFEKSFKENLMDYGRTVKSLKPDESLNFKVRLTECRGCEMPSEIEVTVKGKTLQDYDKGKISRDEGVKLVTVKRS